MLSYLLLTFLLTYFYLFLIDSVRNLVLPSPQKVYHVGDELRCSVNGNPSPKVTMAAVSEELADGSEAGSASVLKVDPSWVGKDVQLVCTASNTPYGETISINGNVTISVSGEIIDDVITKLLRFVLIIVCCWCDQNQQTLWHIVT